MPWCEKNEAEKKADLTVIRDIVSRKEITVGGRVTAFNRILAMAGIDSVDPSRLDILSDDEWKDMFGENAFEIAVILQAVWIEAVCDPKKIVPCSVQELQPLLGAHRRVRRFDPSVR